MSTNKSPQTVIPTLHNLAHSQSHRVFWALEELSAFNGLQFKYNNYPRVTGLHPELSKVHKLGKSPLMTLETTDGSPPPTIQLEPGVLSESRLILNYISREFGRGFFEPETDEDKRRDEFFTEFGRATLLMKIDFATIFAILPSFAPFPFNHLLSLLIRPMLNHFFSDLTPIYQILDDNLSEEKPWFGGSKLGLSDVNMSFGIDTAIQKGWIEEEKYPRLFEWARRVQGREAYRRALEKGCGYELVTYGMKK